MFWIKFFWRDFRADKWFNFFYALCCCLGLIGLLLVESFRNGIEQKVSQNAKNFIAADLSINTRREFTPEELSKIKKFVTDKRINSSKWIETYSLVSNAQKSAKLANLNFISTNFPFYGTVTLLNRRQKADVQDWARLHEKPVVWVGKDLAWALGVKVGDSIKVGVEFFKVDGIIIEDQFSSFRGFNLAPKIFLSELFLKKTELLKFGSTSSHAIGLKLKTFDQIDIFKNELRKLLPDNTIRILGPRESSEQVSRATQYLSDFLSLITLLTYILSLVGLYYFTHFFLSKKLKTFSIYKSLGLTPRSLFNCQFSHLVALTFTSVVTTAILYLILSTPLEHYLSTMIGDPINLKVSFVDLVKIFSLSLGGSTISLAPIIWGSLRIPAASIFQDIPTEMKRVRIYYFVPLIIYLLILAILLSHSIRVGSIFISTFFVIVLLTWVFFKIAMFFLEKTSNSFSFLTSHTLKALSRFQSSSFTIFICLMTGMTLLVFILQLESSLKKEFSQNYGERRPDLFTFDLQDYDKDRFLDLVQKNSWSMTVFSPMIRARLVEVNNKKINTDTVKEERTQFQTREDENAERMKNRGVNLSYRSKLSWSESIDEGKFSGDVCNPDKSICEISLEKSYAKRLGVKLGDKLTFDVSGINVEGIVTSTRTVKWTSFEPNFFILFQPGILEDAPKTFLASFKVQNEEQKYKFFSTLSEFFPMVSILEVSEIVKKITHIFDLMSSGIKFISTLSLFVALVVIFSISFNHLDLRQREMNLYFVLGMNKRTILKIFSNEFFILIGFCIFLSLAMGSALTYFLMKFAFDAVALWEITNVLFVTTLVSAFLSAVVYLKLKNMARFFTRSF